MVDFYAKEPHFKAHMEPIFEKIREAGYKASWVGPNDTGSPDCKFAVASSVGDLTRATKDRKMVFFMEHGAGQTYNLRNRSYAGGPDRQNVCLFLDPGPHVTRANKNWYPHTPHAEIGVPKLDHWHTQMHTNIPAKKSVPTVCISFHWDCHVCPETRSGFSHFKQAILDAKAAAGVEGELGAKEFKLVGHSHPRIRKEVKPFFEDNGIEFLDNFEDVLDQADVYVCDNSSTIFEFASIGKPVVLLNPPMYRKHVKHGLRFWNYAGIGPNASNSESMLTGIREVLFDSREAFKYRASMINEIYYQTDGNATERAVDAILSYIEEFNQTQIDGNYLKVLKASLGTFGLLDRGQYVMVFPSHAIINDCLGKFKKRVSFSDVQEPNKRIRDVLRIAPRNYQLVEPNPALLLDEDDEDLDDYGIHGNKGHKEFNPVDREFNAQEAYIIKSVNDGKKKTEICSHSKHLGEDYSKKEMLRAWERLVSQGIIVPGANGPFTYEVNTIGRSKG